MYERTHLFNPYALMSDTDEELVEEINKLSVQYKDSDMAYDVVFNINLESDLLMIYGEFIARLTEETSLLKIKADNIEDTQVYELREKWLKENIDTKAPSIEYFKAQARQVALVDRTKQLTKEAMLTRFKRAYASLETKQNALKKKLDSYKYE